MRVDHKVTNFFDSEQKALELRITALETKLSEAHKKIHKLMDLINAQKTIRFAKEKAVYKNNPKCWCLDDLLSSSPVELRSSKSNFIQKLLADKFWRTSYGMMIPYKELTAEHIEGIAEFLDELPYKSLKKFTTQLEHLIQEAFHQTNVSPTVYDTLIRLENKLYPKTMVPK